jgi:hypothetical protein
MCNECNSSHKLRQNPISTPVTFLRRKAFYPYDTLGDYTIYLALTLNVRSIGALTEDKIIISLTSPTHQEEVDTWNEIFGIEERYKEKCASKTEGKYWYIQVYDEYSNLPFLSRFFYSRSKHIGNTIKAAKTNPYAGGNFIKAPFLQACVDVGLL